jgi:hypothetical protein
MVLILLLAKSYGRPRKRKYCWKGRKELEYTKSVEIRQAKHEAQKNDLTYDYEIPGLIAYRPRHKFLYSRTQLTY